MLNADIISAIEAFAPLSLQESWDNSGLLVGSAADECTGVLLCVDVTPEIVDEAVARGCNLIVAHHPLIFRGLKQLTGVSQVERAVIKAVRGGVAVYASHTPSDCVATGISQAMASRLGTTVERVLAPTSASAGVQAGLGVVADFEGDGIALSELVRRIKTSFGSPVIRSTALASDVKIKRMAMCGGSGSEFIADAVKAGAQAFLTSDIRYHDFVDWKDEIILLDIGHYESESCIKGIFYNVIQKKFPNFACYYSDKEENPIKYI